MDVWESIAAAGAAIDVSSAVSQGRGAQLDVGAVGTRRAVTGDLPLDLLTCRFLGACAFGVGKAAEHLASEISRHQVLDRDGDELAPTKCRIRLRKRVVHRVE